MATQPTLCTLVFASALTSCALTVAGCKSSGEPQDELGDDASDSSGEAETGDGSGDGDGDPSDTSGDGDGDPGDTATYWKDTKVVIDANCVTCHTAGGIGPFALDTWDQVQQWAPILTDVIGEGSMPPWPPAAGCNDYVDDRALAEVDRALILDWIADGFPEGDVADAPPSPELPEPFVADLSLQIAEPYTPTKSPDDYRCFIVPWPEEMTDSVYITGQTFTPGQPQLVHHIISFVADADEAGFYMDLDEADPEPGYECFGGPGKLDWTARWLGNWVPGMGDWQAPGGTGIEVRPGSVLVVQVHYNTLDAQSEPDQSSLGFQFSDSVERRGTFVPVVDYLWVIGALPMTIPAGESEVHHSATLPRDDILFSVLLSELEVDSDEEIDIWRAALHMHYLGTQISLGIDDGESDQCLLQIDDWDFNWQGDYVLEQPVSFGPGDSLQLDCWYDNSAENQPIIDGEPKEPSTIGWGDGTLDEMCLGVIYAAQK